jgi:hypothetical protein
MDPCASPLRLLEQLQDRSKQEEALRQMVQVSQRAGGHTGCFASLSGKADGANLET